MTWLAAFARSHAPEQTSARAPSKLALLVGSGHRIALFASPFALAAAALSAWRPSLFRIGELPRAAQLLAAIALLAGVLIWAWSVVLILIKVPRRQLITNGPYAWVKHPLYTSVALLVLPALGALLHSWLYIALGTALYVGSRLFSPEEERSLEQTFGAEWYAYLKRVKLPWL